jgi:hypothetical protein
MKIALNDLADFAEMCRKICLNIPDSYRWQWDQKREMAVVTLDKEDAELVFFPLFKEFTHHWDFSSQDPSDTTAAMEIIAKYGLMPGQAFFSSRPICGLVLFVAWWPWGKNERVSMRVGLIPTGKMRFKDNVALTCLSRWLKLEPPPAAAPVETARVTGQETR